MKSLILLAYSFFVHRRCMNCTKEIARIDESGKSYCALEQPKIGITIENSFNVSIKGLQATLETARNEVTPASDVNLNSTFIMPYTYDFPRVSVGKVGWHVFKAAMKCWTGKLCGCNGGDDGIEGEGVSFCGYTRAQKGTKESDDVYGGRTDDDDNGDKDEKDSGATGRMATQVAFAGILWLSALFLFL
ncbi:hypothetical protein FGRMN_5647 [Fusarium graminum]|nr:hypothetical protein FGRMN_5647 [Fusarium graminum]